MLKKIKKPSTGTVLRYLFAAGALIWVFYDIKPGQFIGELSRIKWGLVVIAVVFDILSYICQGIRWEFLIRPLGKLSWIKTTQAIYAGLFTNEILPMRFGEFVRIYLAARWLNTGFASVIPSLAVERLFDGIWLALAVGMIALLVPLPVGLLDAADIFGAVVIILTGLFIFVIFKKRKTADENSGKRAPKFRLFRLISKFTENLVSGIKDIGITGNFYASLTVSPLILVMQALAFWFTMLAYDINLSFWAGAAAFIIVHFGTAIPNAPSNIGSYQLFTVLGLTIFGVEKTTAAGFSVAVFIILTIPLWIIGLLAINQTGLSLNDIRADINKLLAKIREKDD